MARGQMRMQVNDLINVRSLQFEDLKPKSTSPSVIFNADSGGYIYNMEDDLQLNVDILGDWVALYVSNLTGQPITVRLDLMVGNNTCGRLDEQVLADGANYGWGPSFFSKGNVLDGGITTRLTLKDNAVGGVIMINGVVVDA